jgi:hypothetical protein
MVMTVSRANRSETLGFRNGTSSVHTSRTMMLEELSLLLDKVPADATESAYRTAITTENVLGKPTQTTRQLTAKRLGELYAIDPGCTLFRLLRHFWPSDRAARPMLAFLAAAARDSLVRETTPLVQGIALGEPVTSEQVARHLNEKYPARFAGSTALATAQRLASSWAQAGLLEGTAKKKRSRPAVTPVVVTFAVLLGYLCGLRGKRLVESAWTDLLDQSPAEVTDLVAEASRQGWLNYKAAGAVVEITFPGLLKPHEEKAAHEPD